MTYSLNCTFRILALFAMITGIFLASSNETLFAQTPAIESEAIGYDYFPTNIYQRLTLLSEQESAKSWSTGLSEKIVRFFEVMETSPAEARQILADIKHLLCVKPLAVPVSLEEEGKIFTVDDVIAALKQRVLLWEITLDAIESPNNNYGILPQKSINDILSLYNKSEKMRLLFAQKYNGQPWLQFFRIAAINSQLEQQLIAERRLIAPIAEKYANNYLETTPINISTGNMLSIAPNNDQTDSNTQLLTDGECLKICTVVNEFFANKDKASLTVEQSNVLLEPVVTAWLEEMQTWRTNLVHPIDLLATYEYYENNRGMTEAINFSVCLKQALNEKCEHGRKMAQLLQSRFSHAQLKVFISEYLINMMLPVRDPEFETVRDTIAGQQVSGNRRTDTHVAIKLIPSPNRMTMSLNINGRVLTNTVASTFPATVRNKSYNTYTASKALELTGKGLLVGQAVVAANSQVKLADLQTEFDVLPIVGDLVRGIAKDQYDSQQPQIQAETKSKILNQAKQQIDSEADGRFAQFNERIERIFLNVISKQGASLEPFEAKTTNEWLLTSWFLATPTSLGSDTPEPVTPQGAIADLKVHENGINAALERLELAGKEMTVGELKVYLTNVIGRPDMGATIDENDGVIVGFASENPLGIRFFKDRVELSLGLKRLQVDNEEWNDFRIFVNYKPALDDNGNPCLVRDGIIQLMGRLNMRTQIPLRAIFAKIFADSQPIPLKPKLFSEDERFAGLTTGHVRIDNGWFAIALVQQPAIAKTTVPTIVRVPQQHTINTRVYR